MTNLISRILGGCKGAQIIEIIMENYEDWLTIEEISEMSEVNDISYVSEHVNFLVEERVLIEEYGEKGFIYKLNPKNPYSMGFILMEHIIVTNHLEDKIKEFDD